jgi:CubicO group peptidase (beta-lactamase class C family)
LRRANLVLVQLVFVALILSRVTWPVLAQESESQQIQIELNDLERFLDEFFAEQMAELNVPGATVTFVQDGEVLLSKGYGFANWEEQIPFDPKKTVGRSARSPSCSWRPL